MARPKQADVLSESDQSLLEHYGLSDLPEVFAMRGENGMIQEREPCYRCTADGFYGRGTSGTWYQEDSILVYEDIPNDYLEPLNTAAALQWTYWRESLPKNRTQIDIGDMSEAAHMLAKDPRVTDLPPVEYQKAVVKLSEELKLRREGKDAKSLPNIGHNFAAQSGGKAPPILGAKMSEMSQRTPGETKAAPVGVAGGGGVRRAVQPLQVLGGPPPAR